MSNRFGSANSRDIDIAIENSTPLNTKKTRMCVWKQFNSFCTDRQYELSENTSIEALAKIMEDWSYNMKKQNGEDYKEIVIKSMWNITAKMLQQKYNSEYNVVFDPFTDIRFKKARDARNTKRRELQAIPAQRKTSSTALSKEKIIEMIKSWDESTPAGLQKKFYQIAAYELAWRGSEGSRCLIQYFKEERDSEGNLTNRLEYNPVFTKTSQGGNKKTADSKWLVPNVRDRDICPVRLFRVMVSKRGANIKTDRLFLCPNPYWKLSEPFSWYKNAPVGINEMAKWTKTAAANVGINTSLSRISNHSNRSSAVSTLTKQGAKEQEIIKITGHSSVNSLQPYLQLDEQHHANLINNLRSTENNVSNSTIVNSTHSDDKDKNKTVINYNNCVFHCGNFSNN